MVASSTAAYVLQGPHLLDLMIKTIGFPDRLSVTQKIILSESHSRKEAVELTEIVHYHSPDAFYSEIQSQNIRRIHVAAKGDVITIVDEKIAAEAETGFDFYKYILFLRSRPLLQEQLQSIGVDVEISSLGRFQDKIVFVIGARYPDEFPAQLWVERDSFRPVRWIISKDRPGNHLDRLEIRYADWGRVKTFWYPMTIEFFHNSVSVRKIQVKNVQTAPSFSDAIFDIKQLRLRYPSASPAPKEDQGTTGVSEIRKTIDDFEQIFNIR